MPIFQYTALSNNGESIFGDVEAANKDGVLEHIQRLNLLPVEINTKGTDPWWSWHVENAFKKPYSAQALCLFFKQLASLLNAGLELDRAMQLIADLAEDKKWNQIIHRVNGSIRQGKSLAEAMASESLVFPNDCVSMIRAGESTGTLAPTLDHLSALLQRRVEITQRILSALIYPALLLVMALGSVFIILTVVLPEFKPLFMEAKAVLPLPTRIVIAVSDFVQGFWWLVIFVLAGATALWKHVKYFPQYLLRRDKILLRVPLVGQLFLHADISRFMRTLGTLMQNGVTLGAGLAIAGESVANSHLYAAIEASVLAIREGEGLAVPLTKTGCFPKLMLNLIQIGEESGKLEEMLGEVADIYERELQRSVDRMLTLLVPVLTIGMGLIVAFLVASMMMAMLSVNELV